MDKYEIVKRLEYCAENKCDICQEENGSGFPLIDGRCYGFTERLYDAIALLKAQEPVSIEERLVLDKLHTIQDYARVNEIHWMADGAAFAENVMNMLRGEINQFRKAQEPRVMTLEEVKQERICWIEDADDGMTVRLFPATMFGIGEYANGSKSYMFLAQKPWAIDANDCEWWYLIDDYGEIWRCWTSRPTDEQREAVKWDA